jgi:hypothetical protein
MVLSVQELLQHHFPRFVLTSTFSPGRVQDPATMLALINIGDEVANKEKGSKDGINSSAVTGDVIEVSQLAAERQPVYTVR